jgi:hypothetical protein
MNFNYFISDAVGQFLIDAVELLASAGHRLLEDYRFDPFSGLWRHRDVPEPVPLPFDDLLDAHRPAPVITGEEALPGYLDQARVLLAARPDTVAAGPSGLPPELEVLRDFHLPPVCLT